MEKLSILYSLLLDLLNSTGFTALVAAIGATLGYYIYNQQKKDSKRDAANIILLEIQSAERILLQVGESVSKENLPNKFTMQTESWSKYKYLFVRDFDRDEWDAITDFYNGCKLYDEAVSYNSSFFQKNEEQIRVNMLRVPAEYIREYLDATVIDDEEQEKSRLENAFNKANEFQKIYLSRAGSLLLYSPQKPLNDAKSVFESINKTISHGSVGIKLKRLAGV
jgi:hypothetical protein